MDPKRFAGWTRRRHSRRTVVPALAGLGLGCASAHPTSAAPTPAKKRKGKAFGCTKQDDFCAGTPDAPHLVACPDAPPAEHAVCVNNRKGNPICRHADCAPRFGSTAQCIKHCPFCVGTSACFVPFTGCLTVQAARGRSAPSRATRRRTVLRASAVAISTVCAAPLASAAWPLSASTSRARGR